jgi:hypothetical protein
MQTSRNVTRLPREETRMHMQRTCMHARAYKASQLPLFGYNRNYRISGHYVDGYSRMRAQIKTYTSTTTKHAAHEYTICTCTSIALINQFCLHEITISQINACTHARKHSGVRKSARSGNTRRTKRMRPSTRIPHTQARTRSYGSIANRMRRGACDAQRRARQRDEMQ